MIELVEDVLPACRSKLGASKPSWKPEARSFRPASASLIRSERRTLWGVLGFLAGLAALGPVAALGAAVLGALAARLVE